MKYLFRLEYHWDIFMLAGNGVAAWRGCGIPTLSFKSALPAAVAPNRTLSDGNYS